MSTIQIPEELFVNLCKWHLWNLHDPELELRIRTGLQDKADKMIRRVEYSQMLQDNKKTAQ